MRFNDSDIGNLNEYSESNEIKNLGKKTTDDLPDLLNKKAKEYNYSDYIPRPVFSGAFKKKIVHAYPVGTHIKAPFKAGTLAEYNKKIKLLSI